MRFAAIRPDLHFPVSFTIKMENAYATTASYLGNPLTEKSDTY